ncbi:MAG: hypothetical protein ACR2OW_01225 [Methyloligellaceae bacterium]
MSRWEILISKEASKFMFDKIITFMTVTAILVLVLISTPILA